MLQTTFSRLNQTQAPSSGRPHDTFLNIALVSGSLLVLPIVYATMLSEYSFREALQLRHSPVFTLPAAATALSLFLAVRVRGAIYTRIGLSFSRAIWVHGLLALFLLCTRIEYSNQIFLTSLVVSMLGGFTVAWFLAETKSRAVCAVASCDRRLVEGIEIEYFEQPTPQISAYDLVLVPDLKELPQDWAAAVSRAMMAGVEVRRIDDFMEELEGITCVDQFHPDHIPAGGITSYRTRKRFMDVILVLISIPVVLPILGAAMLGVWLTMGRPVIFEQERIGLGGRRFRMFKLRTMRPPSVGEAAMPTNALNTHRITRLGHFLRRYRIDELPQLWNVALGDMSIVGPRPEWHVLSTQYESEFQAFQYRHLVRPGITGWAQVRGGYASDLAETRVKVGYDLFYIKNFSFALDLQILVRTVWTLVSGSGAR